MTGETEFIEPTILSAPTVIWILFQVLKFPWAACETTDLLEFDMIPVLISNAIWLAVCLIYAGLYFWQAGRDRKNGTGYLEED